MIVDCFTDKHHRFAESYTFKPWQTGLFMELLQLSGLRGIITTTHTFTASPFVKSISLGPWSGHTYFAQICSLKDFPLRSKVYATNSQNMTEYSSLTLRPGMCHEPIDMLPTEKFQGYTGGHVRAVVVDMDSDSVERYRESLTKLSETIPAAAILLILDSQVI